MKKLLFLLAALILLSGCTGKQTITIASPAQVLELHTEVQQAYLADAPESIDAYATGRVSREEPADLLFSWEGPEGTYTLTLQEDGTDNELTFTTEEKALTLKNPGLKVDTAYTLTVCIGQETAVCSFRTCAHGPRNLSVDKVDNVRDLGGWGKVKQGLVYRGGRLNQNSLKSDGSVSVKISQKGIAYMTDTLGIRTEIDLRDLSENGFDPYGKAYSVLGDGVTYVACPMKNEAPDFDPSVPENYASARDCLEILADPDAYPIYLHCSVGTDRTGYVAYLVNGLLGVEKEELLRDYLFSNFASVGGSRHLSDVQDKYVAAIDSLPGESLSEKIRLYLTDTVGVEAKTLDAIVAILKNS